MRILSWNVNGLQASIKHGDFEQFRKLETLDVICLQETRTQTRPVVFKDYYHYWNAAEEKKYSGTLTMTLVKPLEVIYGIGVKELDTEGRVLTVDMGDVYVVNVYVPNSQRGPEREEYRRKWDAGFHTFLTDLAETKPVIVCGDFNVTMSRIDIYEENERMNLAEQGYISDERSNLIGLMEDGFVDAYRYLYPDQKNAFTWWSNRRCKREEDRGWRLDYFLVGEPIMDRIEYVVHHQEIKGSDHCPIVLSCAVDDEEYQERYTEAVRMREETKAEEARLTRQWAYRKRHFEEYRVKLSEMQAEMSMKSSMRLNSEVKELQERMLDDIRFKCLAVEKVSATSAPPGVDDVKWKTDADKMRAVHALDWRTFNASEKRIIEIKAKNTGKVRRTGILTYHDKAMSILLKWTFSPIEEACADRSSFAFRPGRTRQDAAIAIANLFTGGVDSPSLYVYVDIMGCYANVQHKWIMGNVPLPKKPLRSLLKSGQIFEGELFPSGEAGISEGSPLSPDVANFVLDGMPRAIYNALYGKTTDIDYANGAMVRYADDVIVAVRTVADAKVVVAAIEKFLRPRGLAISQEKTCVGSIYDGLTVIGFEIKKDMLDMVIRPKEDSVTRFKCSIHDYIINFGGSRRDLIAGVNKRLSGWAGQYRFCDSFDSYRAIDAAVQESLLEAAVAKNPKTPMKKLIERYWYTDENNESWYALRDDKTVRINHLTDTLLIAPRRSRTNVNPYIEKSYFESKRKSEEVDRVNGKYRTVFEKFGGKCFYCGQPLLIDQPKTLICIDDRKKDALWNSAYVHTICVQNDFQFIQTIEDVDGITDYDVYEMLERLSESGTVVRDRELPEGFKYIRLYEYFGRCTKPKVMLHFKDIEEILGFELSEGMKRNRTQWYQRKGEFRIADAWVRQGYKMKRFYRDQQKVQFVALFEDAERAVLPPEITEQKLPKQAKYEIEHFCHSLVKKYALGNEQLDPSTRKGKKKGTEISIG